MQRQSSTARAARGLARAVECKSQFKVALLGAAGGIGQPLALLLKMNRYVSDLSLYDIVNVPGVAADLSHCNTPTQVLWVPVHRAIICMRNFPGVSAMTIS